MNGFIAFENSEDFQEILGLFPSLAEAQNCPNANEIQEWNGTKIVGFCNWFDGKWGEWRKAN